jgi:UTP--glucose-1-phosphate uridylyltransferase
VVQDINSKYGVSVPLVLMNSFNTDDDTRKILPKYRGLNVRVDSFNQSRYPRINKESYAPVAKSLNSSDLEP